MKCWFFSILLVCLFFLLFTNSMHWYQKLTLYLLGRRNTQFDHSLIFAYLARTFIRRDFNLRVNPLTHAPYDVNFTLRRPFFGVAVFGQVVDGVVF